MILRRSILLGAGVGALFVSALTVLVALIFALFEVLKPPLGSAGAEAVVFAVFAAIFGGAAAALRSMSRKTEPVVAVAPTESLVERLSELVQERPVLVLAAAVGAGIMAIRNPRYLGSALRTLATPRVVVETAP